MSARTDGKVPQMLPTGGDYGDRKALQQQMQGASMNQPSPSAGGAGPSPAGAPGSQFGAQRAFAPTARPGEPLTAGVDMGPGEGAAKPVLPDDPYMVARALYQLSPTPELERLIARLARG